MVLDSHRGKPQALNLSGDSNCGEGTVALICSPQSPHSPFVVGNTSSFLTGHISRQQDRDRRSCRPLTNSAWQEQDNSVTSSTKGEKFPFIKSSSYDEDTYHSTKLATGRRGDLNQSKASGSVASDLNSSNSTLNDDLFLTNLPSTEGADSNMVRCSSLSSSSPLNSDQHSPTAVSSSKATPTSRPLHQCSKGDVSGNTIEGKEEERARYVVVKQVEVKGSPPSDREKVSKQWSRFRSSLSDTQVSQFAQVTDINNLMTQKPAFRRCKTISQSALNNVQEKQHFYEGMGLRKSSMPNLSSHHPPCDHSSMEVTSDSEDSDSSSNQHRGRKRKTSLLMQKIKNLIGGTDERSDPHTTLGNTPHPHSSAVKNKSLESLEGDSTFKRNVFNDIYPGDVAESGSDLSTASSLNDLSQEAESKNESKKLTGVISTKSNANYTSSNSTARKPSLVSSNRPPLPEISGKVPPKGSPHSIKRNAIAKSVLNGPSKLLIDSGKVNGSPELPSSGATNQLSLKNSGLKNSSPKHSSGATKNTCSVTSTKSSAKTAPFKSAPVHSSASQVSPKINSVPCKKATRVTLQKRVSPASSTSMDQKPSEQGISSFKRSPVLTGKTTAISNGGRLPSKQAATSSHGVSSPKSSPLLTRKAVSSSNGGKPPKRAATPSAAMLSPQASPSLTKKTPATGSGGKSSQRKTTSSHGVSSPKSSPLLARKTVTSTDGGKSPKIATASSTAMLSPQSSPLLTKKTAANGSGGKSSQRKTTSSHGVSSPKSSPLLARKTVSSSDGGNSPKNATASSTATFSSQSSPLLTKKTPANGSGGKSSQRKAATSSHVVSSPKSSPLLARKTVSSSGGARSSPKHATTSSASTLSPQPSPLLTRKNSASGYGGKSSPTTTAAATSVGASSPKVTPPQPSLRKSAAPCLTKVSLEESKELDYPISHDTSSFKRFSSARTPIVIRSPDRNKRFPPLRNHTPAVRNQTLFVGNRTPAVGNHTPAVRNRCVVSTSSTASRSSQKSVVSESEENEDLKPLSQELSQIPTVTAALERPVETSVDDKKSYQALLGTSSDKMGDNNSKLSSNVTYPEKEKIEEKTVPKSPGMKPSVVKGTSSLSEGKSRAVISSKVVSAARPPKPSVVTRVSVPGRKTSLPPSGKLHNSATGTSRPRMVVDAASIPTTEQQEEVSKCVSSHTLPCVKQRQDETLRSKSSANCEKKKTPSPSKRNSVLNRSTKTRTPSRIRPGSANMAGRRTTVGSVHSQQELSPSVRKTSLGEHSNRKSVRKLSRDGAQGKQVKQTSSSSMFNKSVPVSVKPTSSSSSVMGSTKKGTVATMKKSKSNTSLKSSGAAGGGRGNTAGLTRSSATKSMRLPRDASFASPRGGSSNRSMKVRRTSKTSVTAADAATRSPSRSNPLKRVTSKGNVRKKTSLGEMSTAFDMISAQATT